MHGLHFLNIFFQSAVETIKGKALNSFRKPWLTKSLLRSINKKNKLYKQYLRHRSNEKLLKYKTYKNKLTDLLRVAKRLYFQNQIELNKTNIKQTWRILNNAIDQSKKKKLTYPLVDAAALSPFMSLLYPPNL